MARRAAEMTRVALGFQVEPLMVAIDKLLPSRKVPDRLAQSHKFRQIRASIEEIGLIEPLSVTAVNAVSGQHLLLDGHIRLIALRDLGHEAAPCLVAIDDESYTYNNRINRLSSIQEHFMIRRAVERGVSAERLAKVLGVKRNQISRKLGLLEGICPEAIELLQDRHFSVELARMIRKMKPARQVECVELMLSANNLSLPYAEALLIATPEVSLAPDARRTRPAGVTPEQMARMEREMESFLEQYRLAEQSYGEDILNLVLARGYLGKLLENAKVIRYLKQHQQDVLEQLTAIVATTSIDQ